jgi:outer membrane receptor protein involved in Fe transport
LQGISTLFTQAIFKLYIEDNKQMTKYSRIGMLVLLAAAMSIFSTAALGQATTSEIVGSVTDQAGAAVSGATVTAVHEPSGTRYTAMTNSEGRYALPNMRVGGPYTVTVTSSGFEEQKKSGLTLALGVGSVADFSLGVQGASAEVTVTSDQTFSELRTGASTSVNREVITRVPTINRSINDFTKLSPQYSGGPFGGSFAGQDNRLNNITVDGASFNNSFGLAGQPGDRTGVSPISLDAIEEFQVNVAPYDVRQGNFVGAGVNTVTRSGTNDYAGSVYYIWRKPGLMRNIPTRGQFDYRTYGFRVGGPMPFFRFGDGGGPAFTSGKDKLFFFFSFEDEKLEQPGSGVRANTGGQPVGGSTSRVLQSDLDNLSSFLRTNFGYETGPYQDYNNNTLAKKYLFRGDYNLSVKNKVNFRYIHLDSSTDNLVSTSSSLGFGRSRNANSTGGMHFQNSNYSILENIRSIVGEWTSMFTDTVSNSLILGYTKQDESRGYFGELFPFVDILQSNSTYISFGFEPFTPNNELRYDSLQIQDNLTFYRGNHTMTFGGSYERYKSENVFFPGSQSAYVYNSLADFYTDANGYLANPGRTTSPVSLARFQVRWSNIPGLDKPLQPLEVDYFGLYGQDVWKVRDNFTLTYGVRMDVPFFGETGFANPQANAFTFRDDTGASVQYRTEALPAANILWSPRVGFNWSPMESGRVQVRGGSGIFTGRPAYVWISNQIGNNGILTGFERLDNTTARPWNPDIDRYKPASVTGAPAANYELALTDNDFRFPQLWRTNIATDVKLFAGLVGGAEFLYNRDINGIYYINANLATPTTTFTGADTRPRWTGADQCPTVSGTQNNRLNCIIDNAVVLKNQNVGRSWNLAFTLEKPFWNGLYGKAAYSFGESKNTVDPGSIAFGSWNGNQHPGDPNNPGLGFSSSSPRHRIFGILSYEKEYFKFGKTSVSMFYETRNWGNGSYVFGGDINGDGGTANDLIYIPRDASEMNFGNVTSSNGTILFTAAQQAAAWDAFISQDEYLSKHRGEYARRGGAFLPFVTKVDFSLAQEIFFRTGSRVHRFQIRGDILNFTNLLNKEWGIGTQFTNLQPLLPTSTSSTATCRPGSAVTTAVAYCLRTSSGALIAPQSYQATNGFGDAWRLQIGIRYTFD